MKKQRKLIKKLSILVLILMLILAILLFIDLDISRQIKDFFKGPELVVIPDDCGIVVGNLIHEIKSEESCRIMCHNECNVLGESFVRAEFIEEGDPCYLCNCYCK